MGMGCDVSVSVCLSITGKKNVTNSLCHKTRPQTSGWKFTCKTVSRHKGRKVHTNSFHTVYKVMVLTYKSQSWWNFTHAWASFLTMNECHWMWQLRQTLSRSAICPSEKIGEQETWMCAVWVSHLACKRNFFFYKSDLTPNKCVHSLKYVWDSHISYHTYLL